MSQQSTRKEQEVQAHSNNNHAAAGSADQLLREMQEEISPEATPLWTFINDNAPKIVAVVVSLVVVISAYAFFQGYQESKLEDAQIELSRLVSTADNAERLKALEAFKTSAPAEVLLGVELEIARAAIALNDTAKAENAFMAVKEEEGMSPLGVAVAFNLADLYVQKGEAKKALDLFNSMVDDIPTEFKLNVFTNMGDIASAANMPEEAKSAYQKALDTLPTTEKESADADYLRSKLQ